MNTEAIAITNPATIRAYFEKVRQLMKSGEQYPVDLDEVWPLVYQRKDEAVRALKKTANEGAHYQVFRMSPENSEGRPKQGYRLTVPAMEFFIASRVPEVFDVYSQVFHKTADAIESNVLPATQDELILMLAQRNVDTAKRVSVLEQKFEKFERIQQQAETELLALPAPTEAMPEMTTEAKIIRYVNNYATAKVTPHADVWRLLYQHMYDRYRISVNSYKRENGETKIQLLKRIGQLNNLLTVASNVLRVV